MICCSGKYLNKTNCQIDMIHKTLYLEKRVYLVFSQDNEVFSNEILNLWMPKLKSYVISKEILLKPLNTNEIRIHCQDMLFLTEIYVK